MCRNNSQDILPNKCIESLCFWVFRTDGDWHHLALTWKYDTGALEFYFDGKMQTPYWRSQSGSFTVKDPSQGGVEKILAPQTERSDEGQFFCFSFIILDPLSPFLWGNS